MEQQQQVKVRECKYFVLHEGAIHCLLVAFACGQCIQLTNKGRVSSHGG